MVANFSLNGSGENHDFEPLTRKIFREAVSELAVKAKETLARLYPITRHSTLRP
jgi:hypothetical protein